MFFPFTSSPLSTNSATVERSPLLHASCKAVAEEAAEEEATAEGVVEEDGVEEDEAGEAACLMAAARVRA